MNKFHILGLMATVVLLGAGCSGSTKTSIDASGTMPAPSEQQPAAKAPEGGSAKACPQDAMQCPDGSYVGRGGPNCEFAPCPPGQAGAKVEVDAQAETKVTTPVGGADVKVQVGATIKTETVLIENFAYSQPILRVRKGDKVVFINKDSMRHSVTSDDNGSFDSSLIDKDASFTLDTSKLAPGRYPYHCLPHPTMKGTLIIE